jgi:hypothetical protein
MRERSDTRSDCFQGTALWIDQQLADPNWRDQG